MSTQHTSRKARGRSTVEMDLRRHQRVKVALRGRYMLDDRREFACQTVDMSPGGAAIFGPVKPAIGGKVVIYLDEIGRVEGRVTRHIEAGFALSLAATTLKRDKLADQLTWLANWRELGLREDRRDERAVPRARRAMLVTDDGSEMMIKLTDVSLSGAAMNIDVQPPLGSVVTVGGASARVVRHFDGGIAIEFSLAASSAATGDSDPAQAHAA